MDLLSLYACDVDYDEVGWMHDCPKKDRPVWWPDLRACMFCGRRLDEPARS